MNVTRRQRLLESATINSVFVGFGVSAILWFTILNRSSKSQGFLAPGWTIREIVDGNVNALTESLLNICLFVPFGFFLSRFTKSTFKFCLIIGLLTSIAVETIQYIAMVGYSEVDDVVYNTLGMLIGFAIFKVTRIPGVSDISIMRVLAIALVSTFVLSSCLIAYKKLDNYKYVRRAALHDLDENTPNLLVLNGNRSFLGDLDIDVKYNNDGTLSVDGSSGIRSWLLISEFSLEPGEYYFAGLDGVEEKTVALELEYYSAEEDNFVRFSPDVGPIDSYTFIIDERTDFRAYVGIYECDAINVTMTPVLYRVGGGN